MNKEIENLVKSLLVEGADVYQIAESAYTLGRTEGYNAGLADATNIPLLTVENIREAAYTLGQQSCLCKDKGVIELIEETVKEKELEDNNKEI